MKFNNKPVQSTNDMLQIAKRVNAKLRNAIIEIEKEIALAIAIEHKSVTVPTTAGKNKKNMFNYKNDNRLYVAETSKEKGQSSSTVTSDYFSSNSKSQSIPVKKENPKACETAKEDYNSKAGIPYYQKLILKFYLKMFSSFSKLFP